MDRTGFWAKISISTGKLVALIKVENGFDDYRWNFDTKEFDRLAFNIPDLGMSDDYDSISEEEALELLGLDSWGDED